LPINKTDEREAISWNIVAQNSDFVSYLLRRATNFGLKGDITSKFFTLQAVRDNINFSLVPGEREDLDKIEKEFAEISQKIKMLLLAKDKKESLNIEIKNFHMILNSLKLKKIMLIKKYHHNIMDFLELLGYFPKRENREKMSF